MADCQDCGNEKRGVCPVCLDAERALVALKLEQLRARLAKVEPVVEIAGLAIDELRTWREAYLMRSDLDNNGSGLHVIASREREEHWLTVLRAAEEVK